MIYKRVLYTYTCILSSSLFRVQFALCPLFCFGGRVYKCVKYEQDTML